MSRQAAMRGLSDLDSRCPGGGKGDVRCGKQGMRAPFGHCVADHAGQVVGRAYKQGPTGIACRERRADFVACIAGRAEVLDRFATMECDVLFVFGTIGEQRKIEIPHDTLRTR